MKQSQDSLYAALKDDVTAVADPLFSLSEKLISKYGNFLPHGLVIHDQGKSATVAAIEDNGTGQITSTQTLPLLHEGLRQQARSRASRAIGVAENVTITPAGGSQTAAIKVLLEHREGLCIALYRPFKKRFFRGYEFGAVFTVAAQPEVKPWACD